ncbi:MAG: type II toxin-antitoxin system HicA family toxin [Candidatus Altiarchaeota archaeon]|nr:type II toxin-antitoxin system HicA family toxin [Candidatus Altiarchaeota archaeon]
MKLPRLSGKEMAKLVEKLGFEKVHQVGAHAKYAHPDGRITMVPIHGNEELGPGIINEIMKQIGISREEFIKLARKV